MTIVIKTKEKSRILMEANSRGKVIKYLENFTTEWKIHVIMNKLNLHYCTVL